MAVRPEAIREWSELLAAVGATPGGESPTADDVQAAALAWLVIAAPRIAQHGPNSPRELEAVAEWFELAERAALTDPGQYARTLGYLHARERRWDDARAAFAAARDAGGDDSMGRYILDTARVLLLWEQFDEAAAFAERGLAMSEVAEGTRAELFDVREDALVSAGRADDALALLRQRATHAGAGLEPRLRLAREQAARSDIAAAIATLEYAASFPRTVGGVAQLLEVRVAAVFDPIIAELRAAGRTDDADEMQAHADRLRNLN